MSDYRNSPLRTATVTQSGAEIDEGLRSYMLKVYNLMAIGLAITGAAAWGTFTLAMSNPAFANLIYATPFRWVLVLAPLALVFFLGFRIHTMSVSAAQTTFWAYAALLGASLSTIFIVYTGASIVQTFFISATTFGALSLFGYTTKRDLTGDGLVPDHGRVRGIHRLVVNIFLQSSALQFAISAIGVLAFAGLTAYDTQKIKEMYYAGDDDATLRSQGHHGCADLYLDFINLFMFMLQFLGDRK
jgi:FtsH-binding integral membrane protein